jgi:uncharacterized protein
MPVTLTYPGVYVEEIPSGVRTITGVATSITAFVGRASRGPTDEDDESPVVINNFGDFERIFGGLWSESRLGFAVRDFFLNGGAQAVIVRLFRKKGDDDTVHKTLTISGLTLQSAYPGKWGNNLRIALDLEVSAEAAEAMGLFDEDQKPDRTKLFNITIRDTSSGAVERFLNVSVEECSRRVDQVLEQFSKLARWGPKAFAKPSAAETKGIADAHTKRKAYEDARATGTAAEVTKKKNELDGALALLKDGLSIKEDQLAALMQSGDSSQDDISKKRDEVNKALKDAAMAISDGVHLDQGCFFPLNGQTQKRGLYALDKADLFNIVCIPPYKSPASGFDVDPDLVGKVAAYCESKRAFYIIDAPSDWKDKDMAKQGLDRLGTTSKSAALFFPRVRQPNPFNESRIEEFPPCGAIAGIFARTDTNRGVWKAPAGLDATFVSVPELSVTLTDAENGELNPLGINCLRAFPGAGRVNWGARTMQGADRLASEWKYIPVRRTALFIEESLYRGLQWVVFEPNDEPLWAQIRLNVGAFMHDLFRQGAFQGQTPKDAYFVKCDRETTTQSDINRGIVNIVVGFAPLKPAEFVIIKLQQIAGAIQT